MMFTSHEKSIAAELGVTPCAVAILVKAATDPNGRARGGYAAKRLAEAGYLTRATVDTDFTRAITPLGRQLAKRARDMGW
jgi:hypothetical protein